MFAFPVLQDIFTTIAEKSNFKLHTNRAIARVDRKAGRSGSSSSKAAVAPESPGSSKPAGQGRILVMDTNGVQERFDEIVFACNAEQVIKSLDDITWWVQYIALLQPVAAG